MQRRTWLRRLAATACVLAALGAVGVAALWAWWPSNDEIARRIEAEAQTRLGVRVDVGSVQWGIFPAPHAEVHDVRTDQQPDPITFRRLAVYPDLQMLFDRKLSFTRVELEGAVISRHATRAFRGRESNLTDEKDTAAIPVQRFVFRDVTWISWSGVPVAYDGEFEFDTHWRPRSARLSRPGVSPPAQLDAKRQVDKDQWDLRIVVGGGTAHGQATLKVNEDGSMRLDGTLEPRGLEIQSTLATFNRRSPLAGLASGHTVLNARGETVGELGRSLHTTSQLTVAQGRVLRLDIDRAVKTLGKERAGETALDSLTGRMDTQNTEEGTRVTYSDIQARAGRYSAKGEATIYQRHVKAKGTLDIIDGLVGVPFTVEGPTRKPDFSVPRGFVAGAAIGTAILPGIGTVIGARIGGAVNNAGENQQKTKAVKPKKSATPPPAPVLP